MIADNEMFSAWKPLENRFEIAGLPGGFAETEITDNPQIIARRNDISDVSDQRFVHFLNGGEGTITKTDYTVMPEMRV